MQAFTLNALAAVFEDTHEKRQLAALSAFIKALSFHCDRSIIRGTAVVVLDHTGAL